MWDTLPLLVIFFNVAIASGRYGVDLSVETTAETWSCLRTEHNITYALIRVYRSNGLIDSNCPDSLFSAYNAGIKDLHAYIFPCVSSSAYSVANGIVCDSPSDQVIKSVEYLENSGIKVYRKNENQDDISSGPVVRRIWLDIEDEDPAKYYDTDIAINQGIIEEMAYTADKEGILLGIYTTKTYWTNIMGGIEDYSSLPLWYPRYDGENSMDFFSAFGGWEKVLIKQTAGDIGYCGISQVDPDYMELYEPSVGM